jgi:SAM-dependent methyltransferase
MSEYHQTRFAFDRRRDLLWKTLCGAYFQRLVPAQGCVLDLGTGYGDFINHIHCRRRLAVDTWEGAADYLAPEVEAHFGSVTDLSFISDDCVDFVFASNLFEHLTRDEFAVALEQIRAKLADGGTLNILQPNYRFAYREYFDDYSHISVYSDRSMTDFLRSKRYRVIECWPRFLPMTLNSPLPVWPPLVRLYLRLPFKPLGKQMLVRAVVEK